MEQRSGQNESALFSLRIWRVVLDSGEVEWRGTIQHVLSGEVYYFRGWEMLVEQLTRILLIKQGEKPSSKIGDQR